MPLGAGDRTGASRALSPILGIGLLLASWTGCGNEGVVVRLDIGGDTLVSMDSDAHPDLLLDTQDLPDAGPDTLFDAAPDTFFDAAFDTPETASTDWIPPTDTSDTSDTAPDSWIQDTWPQDTGTDAWVDPPEGCLEKDPPPWSRKIKGAGGAVVFTEVMYQPLDADPSWVELHNPFAIDMDISGWALDGDVSYSFPDDTFVPSGGYLVVASEPGLLDLGEGGMALGPWSGILPSGSGEIELRSNTDRLMDVVKWTAWHPWPVTPAGSGASLSKIDPVARSEEAEGWGHSLTPGGSPGVANPSAVEAEDPGLRFNEVSGGGADAWIELVNAGDAPADLADFVVAPAMGAEATLPMGSLMPGELALLTLDTLGLQAEPGERLFLYAPEKSLVLDGVGLTADPRARDDAGTRWYFPDPPTPGAANAPLVPGTVVINEIMYNHAPIHFPGVPPLASEEEWLELYNAGSEAVEIGGWSLVDAVTFQFPADTSLPAGGYLVVARDASTLSLQVPGVPVVGDFDGKLSNSRERIALLDACGNLVDELRYADGGRWPAWADGGGSSLELQDPRADNAVPEAWAPSIEYEDAAWQTVTYDEVLEPSVVGPDGQWEELVLGLLAAGEVLIDDLSLIEDPEGQAIERLQSGSFEEGGAAAWRLLGTHRASAVIEDPTEPGNHVLRLRATGPAEHMHNHAETTLADGAALQDGVPYSLSFRARWVAGSNQLNSRLYFSRMAHTTLLDRPTLNGTPGAQNSQWIDNLGPTYTALSHAPVVPLAFEPVDVRVRASDPDGVQGVTLWYAQDGGAPQGLPMATDGGGFLAQIPGAAAGTVTQFWVEGTDLAGASTVFPAGGPASRARVVAIDGAAPAPPMHSFRILMTPDDDAWLFQAENVMSNDRVPATVIWNEEEVFYDVGIRLKGSERGRPQTVRVGFSIRFDPARLFRGVYETVMLDRSEGVNFGQREMLINLMMARAGSLSAEYNDLVHLYATRAEHSGPAELQLARFGDQLLSFQFEDGEDGPLYEYELVYYPTTTVDGSPESPKLPLPDLVVGTPITGLGADKEDYRHLWTVKNNRWADDFVDVMAFATAFGAAETDLAAQLEGFMDVDQWLRAFAFCVLANPVDNYGTGAAHNAQFYVRPVDGRVLFFPHDLDFFGGQPLNAIVKSPDLQKLIASPVAARRFYGHLYDILQTAYNGEYMAHWSQQLGDLLPEQDFAGHLQFIEARADWVLNGTAQSVLQSFPEVPFEITTNGGAAFDVEGALVSLEGQGWIDVHSIWRFGELLELPVTWVDGTHWETLVTLDCGLNVVALEARNPKGAAIGADTVMITRCGDDCP